MMNVEMIMANVEMSMANLEMSMVNLLGEFSVLYIYLEQELSWTLLFLSARLTQSLKVAKECAEIPCFDFDLTSNNTMVLWTDNFISDMIRFKTGIGKTGIKTVYNLRIDFGRQFLLSCLHFLHRSNDGSSRYIYS
jgi:hypothetical protein